MIIDSHCHINDEKLLDLQNEILENLEKDNQLCVCCGVDRKTSLECLSLANQNKNVYATVGTHPHEVNEFKEEDLDFYAKLCCENKKIKAIGEIGLDYYYDFTPKEKQKEVLKKQIVLANSLHLPCVFHVREALQDFLQILDEMKDYFEDSSVIHSFSGSVETAKIYIKKGFYLGINGIVTFKNANKMLDVCREIPLENLLIETDSPYLTPVPFRGKPNQPKYVRFVAEKIAELKGLSVEKVIEVTAENAKKLFRLEENDNG